MASDDAFIKKLHAELSVTEGRKDQWQNELDSLSKVPTTAQAASERCALACAAVGSGGEAGRVRARAGLVAGAGDAERARPLAASRSW